MGSSRGFAPVESDYTTVTKYNCLIHRVQLLSKMKVLSLRGKGRKRNGVGRSREEGGRVG